MRMTVETHRYALRKPFVITGHVFEFTDTVRVTLEHDGFSGVGETVGSYYLDETAESMSTQLLAIDDQLGGAPDPQQIRELLPPCGARNALDCAAWDWRAKAQGSSIWSLLDMQPQVLSTVFTVGMADPETMAAWAADAQRFADLKIKLDADRPIERLELIRAARPDANLVIDVNQGWDFEALREYLPHCQRLGVAMIEQPLARDADEELAGFHAPVPPGADESCLHLGEFAAAARRYDVLNIKLDKCGGLTEGLALVEAARRLDMALMVGNMTGTSLSMAPSYVIGQSCRFVDIDGPLLLAEDVPHGLEYADGGRVSIPTSALWG